MGLEQCAQQFSKLFSKLFSTDSVSIQFIDSAKLINSIRLWRIELIEFNNLRGKGFFWSEDTCCDDWELLEALLNLSQPRVSEFPATFESVLA